ncbi:U4/U6 small nuclear ribonucleoprotein prp4 [Tilletia horrida]|uniref:non-specific serine/threonine protein kinase n=1 Tax=Tilletia horrida TaxID=155126 RepID=A0AAN6GW99_9BASI|nr:U4/U6 small nuclear ribonucleoprotein prp4 [Tilletia horrida]KAK0570089.1 U4/U6 small nuclear ribonucleoprotein prp4 [Tilletia horrida]
MTGTAGGSSSASGVKRPRTGDEGHEDQRHAPQARRSFHDAPTAAKPPTSGTYVGDFEGEISAADYDPSMDADQAKREQPQNILGISPSGKNKTETVAAGPTGPNDGKNGAQGEDDDDEWEEVEVEDEDDIDDMFAIPDETPKKKTIRRRKQRPGTSPDGAAATGTNPSGATGIAANTKHDHDDPEGYYRVILGERIGEDGKGSSSNPQRYLVFANLGKGMFSSVVRAKDSQQGDREVAIKIVRSQETMYKAGLKEISILNKLRSMDPEDKKHLVRLEGHFMYRGHLCMVFESLSMNLREVVKRFGKDIGLNIRAVRAYAHQLFQALSLMKKANIMHADIKPDNILVNNAKSHVKLCDLGSASDVSEGEITPYLVSRFYRAPEIILGLPYDTALDTWSIGCTLYELYTGKILFPGRSNNQMLLLIQELRGKFTTKMIRKAKFSEQHFDDTNAFLSFEKDRTTGQDIIRRVVLSKPTEDLRARLLPPHIAKQMRETELKMTQNFIDLLNRTLELDPAKRITPKEALMHPFLV